MIDAADYGQRLHAGDLTVIESACLHRVVRETSEGELHGRDALRAAALADVDPVHETLLSTPDVAGFRSSRSRGHRWLRRDNGWILRETLIVDGDAPPPGARPVHAPLGELRPGRSQLGAAHTALLPAHWPAAAVAVADALNGAWNRCDAAALSPLWSADVAWTGPGDASGDRGALHRWRAGLLAAFPDATLMFERASVAGDIIAVLWRLHGHHHGPGYGEPTGRRIRLIGSSLLRLADGRVVADDTLIDRGALRRQLATAPLVWRGRPAADDGQRG